MEPKENILSCLQEIATNDCSESFLLLYNHYYNQLFRQALYCLNNNADYAQEVVADVFIALWQRRTVLKTVANPDAYLFISVKHAAAAYIEKNYRNKPALLLENLPEADQTRDDTADSDLLYAELQAKYRQAVDKLPPRCAEVFRLVREEQKKYAEVAQLLGISPKTVENQMNKAIKILYEELKENLFSLFL